MRRLFTSHLKMGFSFSLFVKLLVKAWQPSHVELVDMHGTRGIMQAELELIVGRALPENGLV